MGEVIGEWHGTRTAGVVILKGSSIYLARRTTEYDGAFGSIREGGEDPWLPRFPNQPVSETRAAAN